MEKPCAICATPIVGSPSVVARRKYCSHACYAKASVGHPPTNPLKRVQKTCRACGKSFEAGGRSGKHHWTQYCSRECAGHGAVRHPEPRQLSDTEAAYLAGFLDGEGTIQLVRNKSWRVSIYQSDESIIRWIAEVTGTGFVAPRTADGRNLVKQSNFKMGWIWQLYSRNAGLFLKQLLPYLKVKRAKAEEVVQRYVDHPGDLRYKKEAQATPEEVAIE